MLKRLDDWGYEMWREYGPWFVPVYVSILLGIVSLPLLLAAFVVWLWR